MVSAAWAGGAEDEGGEAAEDGASGGGGLPGLVRLEVGWGGVRFGGWRFPALELGAGRGLSDGHWYVGTCRNPVDAPAHGYRSAIAGGHTHAGIHAPLAGPCRVDRYCACPKSHRGARRQASAQLLLDVHARDDLTGFVQAQVLRFNPLCFEGDDFPLLTAENTASTSDFQTVAVINTGFFAWYLAQNGKRSATFLSNDQHIPFKRFRSHPR